MIKIEHCWQEAYRQIVAGREDKAIAICKTEPCASGSLDCQNYLGWNCYEANDLVSALEWFKLGANKGSGESNFGVASVYFVQKDFENAIRYFKEAADKKYPRAYHWVGYMYEHGLGETADAGLAISYYGEGAKNGYLVAERSLIHMVFQTGTLLDKLSIFPKLLTLVIRGLFIAYKNAEDERIADVPNAFDKEEKEEEKVSDLF